ncbi:MAG: hypothetical protein ACTSPV_00625 [Candidatus Hodarchaeales archaeon]
MKTIAFITRVHPKRPNMLKKCIESIKMQTSNDYIHILHRDDKTSEGYGVASANRSLTKIKDIDAEYAMILDDDDILIDSEFVETFRKKINRKKPEIIFFKGIINGVGVFPRPEVWKAAPKFAMIASFCLAVRRDVWMANIYEFGRPTLAGLGGDFSFISSCYKNTKNHFWWDRVVARTQKGPGRGKGERDHA